jgi:hypothetical protein
MAVYGLKYTIPFKDIDNLSNVVEIYQDGYTGSVTELIATDAPAVHKYEREDNEDLTSSIMSATLSISFYSTDVTDFRSFYSEGDRVFLVIHKFEGNIVFKGYLLNDITGEPFQEPPYQVMLTATDGLAQLKEFQMTGPEADTDLGTLIFNQLNSLDLQLDFEVCNDLYEALVMDNTKSIFDQAEGENLLIQAETFDALELNAFDFLLEICKTFGWVLFQRDGRWIIQRAIARNIDTTTIYIHDWDTFEVKASYENNAIGSAETWYSESIAALPFSNIIYADNKFVAISNGSFSLLYSADGISWTTVTIGSFGLRGITYGAGKFVAVGAEFSGIDLISNVQVSTDGITWTRYTPFTNGPSLKDVTFGNGLFVAVADGGGNRVITSTDGISWTLRIAAENNQWQSIAYGNGKFVAIANSGTNRVMYSTDGISWTGLPINLGSNKIIFADGKFTTGSNYSTDGITWTNSNVSPIIPFGITYGNGLFVLVGQAGTDRIAISTDATSWQLVTAPELNPWQCIAYGAGKFVALSFSGTNRSMVSYSNEGQTLEQIGDQENINTDWIPVNSDQLLQYQRPIKKLTLTQGDLGQSIIANGDSFNEDSWTLDNYYRPNNWTINVDPANVPQIFPENIPSQSTWDDEKGVSWDFRFIPSTYTIESQPVFLDNAGLIIDFESQVEFELANGSVVYYFKHKDVNDNVTFLTTEPVIGQEVLTWSSTRTPFSFNSTRADDVRTFKMSSFILPSPGFLSVEIHGGTNGATIIKSAKLIPTYLGEKNPTEVKKVYETTRGYTTVREDDLVFSDLCIAASKNWLKIGGLPAIVFVEKSLAATPDIIQQPSGAVSQVNKLTDSLLVNTLNFSGGFMDGEYSRQYTAAAGFTIDSVSILKGDLLNTGNTAADLGTVAVVLSSTQVNVVFFDGNSYDTTEQGNAQVTITLKDVNNNTYQVSTFLFQIRESGGGIEQYDIINISFEAQSTEGSYSPTLRDTYARNVLTLYNVLSFRFEGSFRRKGLTMGNAYLPASLNYSGYTSVRLQVIGWEYDLASRVVRITFGQVPTAYVYPIN